MQEFRTLSDSDFEHKLLNCRGIALIEAWAPGCRPCKAQKVTLQALSKSFPDIEIFSVDAQNNPRFAKVFDIHAVPTMMLFVDGHLRETFLGPQSKDELTETLLNLSAPIRIGNTAPED